MKIPPIPLQPPPPVLTILHSILPDEETHPHDITPHIHQVSDIPPQLQYYTINHVWYTISQDDGMDEKVMYTMTFDYTTETHSSIR